MSTPSFRLDGRVALVTGGYGIIGGTLADGLAAAGARVAVLGRRTDEAEKKAEQIRASGAEAMALTADVLNDAQLKQARSELTNKWQRVDILINAAGGNV